MLKPAVHLPNQIGLLAFSQGEERFRSDIKWGRHKILRDKIVVRQQLIDTPKHQMTRVIPGKGVCELLVVVTELVTLSSNEYTIGSTVNHFMFRNGT